MNLDIRVSRPLWAVRLRLGQAGFRGLRRLLHILKPALEVRVIANLTGN